MQPHYEHLNINHLTENIVKMLYCHVSTLTQPLHCNTICGHDEGHDLRCASHAVGCCSVQLFTPFICCINYT